MGYPPGYTAAQGTDPAYRPVIYAQPVVQPTTPQLNDPLPVPVPVWGGVSGQVLGHRTPVAATFPMAFYGPARSGLTDFVSGRLPSVLQTRFGERRGNYRRIRRYRI